MMKGANDSRAIMFAIHAAHVTNNPTIRTTNICIAITYSRLTWPVLINHNYKMPTRIVKSHKLHVRRSHRPLCCTRAHYYRAFPGININQPAVYSIFPSRLSH